MKLYYKPNNNIVTVYTILDDSHGYPKFLIRENNQWIYKSAKHFIPIDECKFNDNNVTVANSIFNIGDEFIYEGNILELTSIVQTQSIGLYYELRNNSLKYCETFTFDELKNLQIIDGSVDI